MTINQQSHVSLATSFVEAVVHVFRDMAGWELQQERPRIIKSSAPIQHVTGVIGLVGDTKGIIALGMDRSVAIKVTETLLEEKICGIGTEVVDATAELVNMITGQIRVRMQNIKIQTSLPVVIVGKSTTLNFPSKAIRVNVPFHTLWGELCIDFAFDLSQDSE